MERLHGFAINSAPANIDLKRDLPSGFLDFFLPLHARFTPRQRELVAKRKRVLTESHAGKLPNHLPASEGTTGKWNITVLEWCQDQRNQVAGPGGEGETGVKELNSRAPGGLPGLGGRNANFLGHPGVGIKNV